MGRQTKPSAPAPTPEDSGKTGLPQGGLTFRFAIMMQCDEESCGRWSAIPAGDNLYSLTAQHFYCYMNPHSDVPTCTHVPVPGERWTQSPNSGSKRKKGAVAAKAERVASVKASRKRIKLDADAAGLAGSLATPVTPVAPATPATPTRAHSGSPQVGGTTPVVQDATASPPDVTAAATGGIPNAAEPSWTAAHPSPLQEAATSAAAMKEKRQVVPAEKEKAKPLPLNTKNVENKASPLVAKKEKKRAPTAAAKKTTPDTPPATATNTAAAMAADPLREPFEVGNTIMVLYGKTVYPGKIIRCHPESDSYLVQYDGLSASRSEWRSHADLISIHKVSQGRRRRMGVSTYAPMLA